MAATGENMTESEQLWLKVADIQALIARRGTILPFLPQHSDAAEARQVRTQQTRRLRELSQQLTAVRQEAAQYRAERDEAVALLKKAWATLNPGPCPDMLTMVQARLAAEAGDGESIDAIIARFQPAGAAEAPEAPFESQSEPAVCSDCDGEGVCTASCPSQELPVRAGRELSSHKVPGLNEVLTIEVLDAPGAGNACHRYKIHGPRLVDDAGHDYPEPCCIAFQRGPILETGPNGVSIEALLVIVEDRLLGFQSGGYACRENAVALTKIQEALMWLQRRTRDRIARGVEGASRK
jgi:hypothetical protein